MIDFERSRAFADWLDSLRDIIGKARIIARLELPNTVISVIANP